MRWYDYLISCLWSLLIRPENKKKPLVFWCFQGVSKEISGMKWDNHNDNGHKMKNKSHRYDINRPRSRHGHKYSKNKRCLSMITIIYIKQHLRNTWSPIYEIVKQLWGWVEKKRCLYIKSVHPNKNIYINDSNTVMITK